MTSLDTPRIPEARIVGWGALYQQTPPIGQVPNAAETVYAFHINYLRTMPSLQDRQNQDKRAILKAYLVDSPAGLFLLDKTGKIAARILDLGSRPGRKGRNDLKVAESAAQYACPVPDRGVKGRLRKTCSRCVDGNRTGINCGDRYEA